MLPEFIVSRKTYLITGIVFLVFCVLGFSFAYFQRASLIGNISDNTIMINTVNSGGITPSFITTYENRTNEVETGILNLTDTNYQELIKLKVQNIYDESQAISINWNFVTSTIDNSYSSYSLYECNETNYSDITITTVASNCSLLSPTTNNVLPTTGEKSKLQSSDELVLGANAIKYYVVSISIGIENSGKSFQANIKVKDRRSNTLVLDLNGGSISSVTSIDLKNGSETTIPVPTKTGDAFFEWEIISGTGASVIGDVFYMGGTDVNMRAIWLSEKFTYSGSYAIEGEENHNFKIRFLTDGTFIPNFSTTVNLFMVGGGGGGGYSTTAGYAIRGGGGGGYTKTESTVPIESGVSYPIDIGSGGAVNTAGAATTAFNYTVSGGGGGRAIYYTSSGTIGGAGGSGGGAWGAGGTNGGNGANKTNYSAGGPFYGGKGQGSPTREFGDTLGTIYAYGGAGGNDYAVAVNPPSFTGNNTGTGGNVSEAGSSGIAIIRNPR